MRQLWQGVCPEEPSGYTFENPHRGKAPRLSRLQEIVRTTLQSQRALEDSHGRKAVLLQNLWENGRS